MKYYRLVLNQHKAWFLPETDSAQYLYWDFDQQCFNVGSIHTCYGNKHLFREDELKQMQLDYDLSYFRIEETKWTRKYKPFTLS